MNTKSKTPDKLERTSVLLRGHTMSILREIAAEGNRPLSREIRAALEAHVKRARKNAA